MSYHYLQEAHVPPHFVGQLREVNQGSLVPVLWVTAGVVNNHANAMRFDVPLVLVHRMISEPYQCSYLHCLTFLKT